jgi:hypothetical protein
MASCSGQLEGLAERDIRQYWASLRRSQKVRMTWINIKIAKYSAVASNGEVLRQESILSCGNRQKKLANGNYANRY